MQNLNEDDIIKYKNLIQKEINNLNIIKDENNFINLEINDSQSFLGKKKERF